MCLLIVKPAGVPIPDDTVDGAHSNNSHGCGVAFTWENKVRIAKGLWEPARMKKELAYIQDMPALVHFRLCTHGKIMESNCHPFELNGGWSMAHNGVIPIKTSGEESDTAAFVDQVLNPHIATFGSAVVLDPGFTDELLPHIGGSRMAFLNGNGETLIVGEEDGHWKDGAWYSNHSYEEDLYTQYRGWKPTFKRRGMFPDYREEVEFDPWDTRISEFRTDTGMESNGIELNSFRLECDVCGKRINGKFLVNRDGTLICRRCRA